MAAFADDVRIRVADEGLSPDVARFDTKEFSGDDQIVLERDGVKVTAFQVDHGEKIKPAYGYRIDYRGRSVVLSGDTRVSENLIRHARGVDLLVHEAVIVNDAAMAANPGFRAIAAHHTTGREAGQVFARARPRLAVLSHLVFLTDLEHPRPTAADLQAQAREGYDGPMLVGSDLMAFNVGQTEAAASVVP